NTLIMFAGDNGAPTKLRTGRGTPDVNGWNGSCNVPMRGNKGNLLEGGIRVPMFAYWKGTILPGQKIDEMVTTLDFTATTLAAGGGDLPPEFDGANILPRLTGKASSIIRTKPMFWDFYESQAARLGDWKLFRNASGDRLFNIADDPSELANVIHECPERAKQLAAELDDWVSTLRPEATAALAWDDSHWGYALTGAPAGVKPDPRYRVPYDNPVPTAYPAPMTGQPLPHGKGAPAEKSDEKPEKRSRGRSRGRPGQESMDVSLGKPSKMVDGWIAAGACSLFQKEGVLVVKCDGDRSFLSDRQLKTLKGGPFKLKFRMKSHAQGKVSVVYDKPSPAHMVNIPMKHDGEYHDYEVAIPDETLETIRLSLTKAEGTIEVDWIRILDNTGKTVRSWEF
ncbi:MAG: sulfatase-like hydrolase/transferase, partial [Planctomycetes bacterium]|nr:sulfatase-like hydrolase/transferase [Planctomycetota bacterium]